ncbi:RNA polymerase sigma-70 factor [Prevotella sp. KH2C16]|uniref:RNA polymerase sigma-70 factor n=1 Tax=Prevotella sp. KH2C16 TaxID=1855325 RepID=UPI0008F0EBD6|nr:RNA polymerase sigma-70 factor [Prevotella sp. KH2C16]SFG71494.1 RNA polymerase sigma-70 factor, ECF subfamily [Prevotella sp. KH2C16]
MLDRGDQKLVMAISQGDRKAFNKFFAAYYPKILSFVRTITKNDFLADTVVQDLFVHIWMRRSQLTQVHALDSYLFASARNIALNLLKSQLHAGTMVDLDDRTASTNVTEEDIAFQELREHVLERISHMSPQRQRVFYMSRIQGRSNEEIAKELGISIRTVETHIYGALKELRAWR